jgi:hypothetical protein
MSRQEHQNIAEQPDGSSPRSENKMDTAVGPLGDR